MKQGQDISVRFPGIVIVHQMIRASMVKEHHHEGLHEGLIPLQGEIHVNADGRDLKAGPGRLVYLPPDCPHTFRGSPHASGERLIFLVEDATWKKCGGGAHPPGVIPVSQLAKELLFHLLIHPKTRAFRSLVETLVGTLGEMLESPGPALGGTASDPRVRKALACIESRFQEPLSAESLARESGMSVRNLNRLFLEELGLTPKQAITLHRVERAKALLAARRPVTDVALEVGYGSLSQFITVFRRTTGKLPSEWV